MLERNRDIPEYQDDIETAPTRVYGAVIAKEDVIEIREITDRLLGIVRPLDPVTTDGEPFISWKLAREIHLLEAASYAEAKQELEQMRGRLVGIGTIDDDFDA